MLTKDMQKSLLAVAKELNENEIKFTIIEPVASVIQGASNEIKKIDFIIKFEEVEKALSCLSHFFIEEIHTPERYSLHLGVYGIETNITGNKNPESKETKALNARKEIELQGTKIYISPLSD